jgi:hypothetical protein
MAWLRKVNRHVQVFTQKTVGGNTQYVKIRSGTITALGASELVTVRFGHAGGTLANVDRRIDPNANAYPVYIAP